MVQTLKLSSSLVTLELQHLFRCFVAAPRHLKLIVAAVGAVVTAAEALGLQLSEGLPYLEEVDLSRSSGKAALGRRSNADFELELD